MSKYGKHNNKQGRSTTPASTASVVSTGAQKRAAAPESPSPSPSPAAARTTADASLSGPAVERTSPSDTTPRTLQQQRAAFALQAVQAWVKKEVGVRKKLNSYAAKMPFMVHANGLGQTTAFYCAKGDKDPHHDLYCLLGEWLTRNDQPFAGKANLLDGITSTDLHTYMAAQAEAMLFLSWVKQFAAAFLESE